MARFKIFAPLILVLLLVPATASAGTFSHSSGEDWFAWMRSIWVAVGSTINPSGFCAKEPRSNIGCGLDPNGHCGGTLAPTEIGCTLDTGGRCRG